MSITILDENDNSPEFDITSDLSVNIPEDTPIGQRVAVVLGRDRDAGRNGLVSNRKKQKKHLCLYLCLMAVVCVGALQIKQFTGNVNKNKADAAKVIKLIIINGLMENHFRTFLFLYEVCNTLF